MINEENIKTEETVPEDKPKAEEDNSVLKSRFASDIASRGTGNRVTAAMEKASRVFGLPTDDETQVNSSNDKASDQTSKAKDSGSVVSNINRPTVVIGRGGIAAILLFLFFVPLLYWAVSTALDLNSQVNGYKGNYGVLQANQARDAGMVALLNSPNLKTYSLRSADPQPVGSVSLHVGGTDLWGISFSGLGSVIPKDRFFAVWLVRKTPKAGLSDYVNIASFGSGNSSAGWFIVAREKLSLDLSEFGRIVVTDEPLDKDLTPNPAGVVRFSLDVANIKFQ